MYMMVGHTPDHSAEPALGQVTHTLSLPSFDTNPLPLGEGSWAEGIYKTRLSSFLAMVLPFGFAGCFLKGV